MYFDKGLILEGGGMRGIYTCGVLDSFLEMDIEFREIYGVSAGACHSCSYVSKQPGRAFRTCTDYLDDREYCGLYSLITTGDLFGVDMLYNRIPNELDPYDFDAFNSRKSRLYAVVCNCETGQAEYKELTDMKRDIIYVRASASLPLCSRMVEIDGRLYLDGGIADSIPLMVSQRGGNKKNIVILTRHRQYRKTYNKLMPLIRAKYKDYPKLIEALADRHNMYNRQLDYIADQEKKGKCLVIAPQDPVDIGRIEKDPKKLTALYKQGYEDGRAKMSQVMDFLKND